MRRRAQVMRPLNATPLAAWVAAVTVSFMASVSSAAETQGWTITDARDHATSEARGVVVLPDGSLTLGPRAQVVPVDSVDVLWCVAVRDDGSVVLGGAEGRLFTWSPSRGLRDWVRLPVGQVFALLADGNDVLAGTGPDGWVFRISAAGDTLRLAATGERYVWGLAPAGDGNWFAATGTSGKLLSVNERGVRVVLDTDETNLVSIIPDGSGGVFAGGDTKGRIFHVDVDGRARTLYDAAENEVRALAWDGTTLYAAALSAKAIQNAKSDGGAEPPRPSGRVANRDRSVIYRVVPDSSAVAWWAPPQPMVFAAEHTPAGVVFATGNRSGLYALDGIGAATRLLAPEQGQITGLDASKGGALYAVTSHPAALWIVGPDEAREGELISPVRDAKRIARFGKLHWDGVPTGGRIGFATRSGNTDAPDTTWSDWAEGPMTGQAMAVRSPDARFVQWRLRLRGADAVVTRVEMAMRENNVPPLVANLRIAPQARGVRDGRMSPRNNAVTQELRDGRKVEFSLKRQADVRDVRALPEWMQGLRAVQWSGADPNGDPLRFDLDVIPAESDARIAIAEDLVDSTYVWDTHGVPDGRYRLRVTASDAAGNAIGEERSSTVLSRPFTVDNTDPSINALDVSADAGGVRVKGRASDAASPLWRIEVALDEQEWRSVTPEGGILDDRSHAFEVRIPNVDAGEYGLRVRVVDRAGNTTIRTARVTVR